MRHLLRSIRRTRRLLRQLPIPTEEMEESYPMPTRLTVVRTPMRLRAMTALTLRKSLEDQVILEERMAQRMRDLIGMASTYLRKG